MSDEPTPVKRGAFTRGAWEEARALVWQHRRRLALGLLLMLVNRLAGLILPWSPKILIDQVIGARRTDLLDLLVIAVGAATVVQAVTSFALSQILGVAAQRAITDMRRSLQAHVARLPIAYFDSTKTGILISRIMTDAEGIRNLVGTGLVQLLGGLLTATLALGVLFYLNWQLTVISILVLGTFAGVMALAFSRLRPLFRERGKINAEVTGRLTEALGGIRIVKSYTAEKREEIVFTKGAHRLFRNIAKSMTGVSATTAGSTVVVGIIGAYLVKIGRRDALRPVAIGVVLALAATWWVGLRQQPPMSSIESLAVLPFANLSGDPEQDYFASGMTEELLVRLAGIGGLTVKSRTSVSRYRDSDDPLPSIARTLGVDALVEGSVSRSADGVRIRARLVQARPERALWSRSYDRDLRDAAEMHRRIYQSIRARDVDEAQRQEFYNIMLADSDRLLLTVEQVLRAGRTGHRRRRIANSVIDVDEMVRECLERTRLRYGLDETHIVYTEPSNGNGTKVSGDPDELRAAFSNLLDNAVKYSDDEVQVSVSVSATDEAGAEATSLIRLAVERHYWRHPMSAPAYAAKRLALPSSAEGALEHEYFLGWRRLRP